MFWGVFWGCFGECFGDVLGSVLGCFGECLGISGCCINDHTAIFSLNVFHFVCIIIKLFKDNL
jgi:hypothetical protein